MWFSHMFPFQDSSALSWSNPSGPRWLQDTLPSSTYNGSYADVNVLVDTFEVLGVVLAALFACLHFAALWFLLNNSNHWTPATLIASITEAFRPPAPRGRNDGLASLACSGAHGVRHMAVIMDGNRRYGRKLVSQHTSDVSEELNVTDEPSLLKSIATSPLNGHRAGGEKLMEFIQYCIRCKVEMLTVYAFSTENWSRPKVEIDVLMCLFEHFFQRIRLMAKLEGIFIRFVSTEPQLLPSRILTLMRDVEEETRGIMPRRIVVNCCVSYGGRSEIVQACRRIQLRSVKCPHDSSITQYFNEESISREMLRSITQGEHEDEDKDIFVHGSDPQLLLRTSGEARISNFLLYECAYTEFAFIEKAWPEITEDDVIEVLADYAKRHRRFGK